MPNVDDLFNEPGFHRNRFVSTMNSGMEVTSNRIYAGEVDDRAVIAAALKERKRGNTQTSIDFGHAPVSYSTSNTDMMETAKGAKMRDVAADKREKFLMKQRLQRTNFNLGKVEIDYSSTAQNAMYASGAAARDNSMSEYRGMLQDHVDKFIKTSSVYLGGDERREEDWRTTMSDCMNEGVYGSLENQKVMSLADLATKRRGEIKEEIANARALKKELRAVHFTLNTADNPPWETDMESNFRYEGRLDPISVVGARGRMADAVKKDLRATHYTLGDEPVRYVTGNEEASNAIFGKVKDPNRSLQDIFAERAGEIAREKQRAIDMKAALQKVNYTIGHDPVYMSAKGE